MLNLLKWPKGDTRHIHWEGRAVLWVVRKEEEEKQEETAPPYTQGCVLSFIH